MSKTNKDVVGTCALCRKDNVVLELSHIIPKFITRRIQKKIYNWLYEKCF